MAIITPFAANRIMRKVNMPLQQPTSMPGPVMPRQPRVLGKQPWNPRRRPIEEMQPRRPARPIEEVQPRKRILGRM